MAAIVVSVVDLISLFLALIVGNSDIKDVKSLINALVQYSGTSANANLFLKSSVAAGFVLELLMILVMIGSYWINELVIKPYVFGDKSGAKLNPFDGVTGTAKARARGSTSGIYSAASARDRHLDRHRSSQHRDRHTDRHRSSQHRIRITMRSNL